METLMKDFASTTPEPLTSQFTERRNKNDAMERQKTRKRKVQELYPSGNLLHVCQEVTVKRISHCDAWSDLVKFYQQWKSKIANNFAKQRRQERFRLVVEGSGYAGHVKNPWRATPEVAAMISDSCMPDVNTNSVPYMVTKTNNAIKNRLTQNKLLNF